MSAAASECSYFENVYPAQHARWLAEGRLLLFCSASSGLGSWLAGVHSLLAASILTERALILSCPGDFCSHGFGIETTIGQWFRGRNFDWGAHAVRSQANLSAYGATPMLPSKTHFPDTAWQSQPPVFSIPLFHLASRWPHPLVYNRTYVQGLHVSESPGASIVKLCASEHTGTDKFLRGDIGARGNDERLSVLTGHKKWPEHCALQALLEPTAELNAIAQSVFDGDRSIELPKEARTPVGLPKGEHGLVPLLPQFVVLHARLGDGSMWTGASRHDWKWNDERRRIGNATTLQKGDLQLMLACFAQQHKNLPHLVLTDTASVAVLAEEAGMLTTRRLGSAVHLGQSDVQRVPPRDVAKLYVDWLLMRRAAHAYRFGVSQLLHTARTASAATSALSNRCEFGLQGYKNRV